MSEAEVVIAGGGPVGLGLAIELGQRGIRAVVIEKHDSPQPIPKGQNLTQRTMEHFHAWGAEGALRAARTIPKEYGIGGLTAYRNLLGEYHFDWLQRDLVGQFYFTENERLPQYATEAVLRARVSELKTVELWLNCTVTAVAQDDEGVSVTVHCDDGRETVLRTEYLVGCDGSRSQVRESAGITQTLSDHDRLMSLLVFRSDGLNRLLECFPGKSFYKVLDPALGGYWKFFGRVDLDGTWFFHAPVESGNALQNRDLVAMLHEAAGARFDVDFSYVGYWNLRFAIADTYRAGRVFIAGDAAHSHPPYGGYGVNTGFEDARNLGWKLAARLQGWGGETLLESYDAERRPVFASTARDFIEKSIGSDRDFLARFDPERDRAAFEAEWNARGGGAHDEVQSFEPHYEGSPVVACEGTPSAVGRHALEARAGHHLAPVPLSPSGMLHEMMGDGLTLLGLGGDAQAADHVRRQAAALHIPLKVITDDAGGPRGRLAARYVIVRPDLYVAWAGDSLPTDLDQLLRRMVGL